MDNKRPQQKKILQSPKKDNQNARKQITINAKTRHIRPIKAGAHYQI